MDLAPLVVLVIINKKVVDWLRELIPLHLRNKTVQALAWVVGIGLAFLFAASAFGDGIDVWEGRNLGSLDAFGVVIFGLAIGSGAGAFADAIERKNPTPDTEKSGTL